MILFFYTDWCPLCPVVQDYLQEIGAAFVRVNFDENKELVEEYKIIGVPTVVTPSGYLVGFHPKEDYEDFCSNSKQ
jgi:thiol-disulfide isomerase/thioredoxin